MGINWESKVLSSVGYVIDNAQHISVSEKHIETVADWLAYEEFGLPKNNQTNKNPDNFIRTTMLINTLNFAFTDFDTSIKYAIERDGQLLSDSEAMFAQVHEAIDSDCPRSSASFPGNAPGVSTNVITGKLNFSANFKRR